MGGRQVTFSSPMNPDSIDGNFVIDAGDYCLGGLHVRVGQQHRVQVGFDLKPSTDDKAVLDCTIEGRDGHGWPRIRSLVGAPAPPTRWSTWY